MLFCLININDKTFTLPYCSSKAVAVLYCICLLLVKVQHYSIFLGKSKTELSSMWAKENKHDKPSTASAQRVTQMPLICHRVFGELKETLK